MNSFPRTATIPTVISLPRKSTKSPIELMAATLSALATINMNAFFAASQKLYPYIAETHGNNPTVNN